jgi:hypothetical protein
MPQSRNKDLESKLVEQVYEQLCAPVKTRDDLLRLCVHTLGYTFVDGRISASAKFSAKAVWTMSKPVVFDRFRKSKK